VERSNLKGKTMLGKLLTPFTTAAPIGVAIRDVAVSLGVILATLGTLGMLSAEQVDQFRSYLETITDPTVIAAFGVLLGAGTSIYRIVAKSMSDKAAEVAKEVDAKIPKADPVEIKTPGPGPNITVPGEK
jgi:hypothetical protein